MFYTVQMDSGAKQSVHCLIDRASLSPDSVLDSGFLPPESCHKIHAECDDIAIVLKRLLSEPGITHIVVCKNPRLVLDDGLRIRLGVAIAILNDYGDGWALASAGGLGLRDERYCALFSSSNPFFLSNRDIHPIIDAMVDLYIVHADALRDYVASDNSSSNAFFETGLILHGYKTGRVSLFVPVLRAGVDGPFVSRDLCLMSAEAATCFPTEPATFIVRTLWGPITIEGSPFAQMPDNPDPLRRRSPLTAQNINETINRVIARYLPILSLSIITRTQFKWPHLLRRMLTSVVRATIDGMDVEIILSTDIDKDCAEREWAKLQEDFPTLNIGLVVNHAHRNRRVGNMVSGMRASAREYVWMIDDDVYVDRLAFQTLRTALFGSSRPLIIVGSQTHAETWLNSDTEFPILAASKPTVHWPASGWRDLFRGYDRLPICSGVIPRDFLLSCLDRFEFRFDLSEHFTLFLLLLTAPDLPRLLEVNADAAHISIWESGENSATVEHSYRWTRDISGALYDLLHGPGKNGLGAWSVVAAAAGSSAANWALVNSSDRSGADLRLEYNRRIASMQREVAQLEMLLEKRQG